MNPADAIALLEQINAAAEADMLAGNPVTGAHHRAIEKRLKELRVEVGPSFGRVEVNVETGEVRILPAAASA